MALHPSYPIEGCDISSHQGKMDFTISAGKMAFMYIRAGSAYLPGNGQDPRFSENQELSQKKLPRGFYYVIRVELDIPSQVNSFINIISDANGELPPVLDIERNDEHLSPAVFTKRLDETLELMDNSPLLAGTKTGIYTSPGFWDANIAPGRIDLGGRTLWIAHYHHNPHQVLYSPTLPKDWPYWTLWQMSNGGNSLGHEYGASSPSIDINAFSGDAADFTSWFGVPPNPTSPGEPEPPWPAYVITRTSVNIRQGPGVAFTKIGTAVKSSQWPVATIVQGQDGLWVMIAEGVYIAYWLCSPVYP